MASHNYTAVERKMATDKNDIRTSEITDEAAYKNRRKFLKGAGAIAIGGTLSAALLRTNSQDAQARPMTNVEPDMAKMDMRSAFSTDEPANSYEDITTYNNFYEFGTGKDDPARMAKNFQPRPWKIKVSGEAEMTGEFDLEDILAWMDIEERIYRLRCVEAWSMVIPWMGFELGALLKRFKPLSDAKYVEFRTLHDPKQMPGQRRAVLDWPYVEGLRMDEAMHPLTLMATGLYGRDFALPNQNGAPMRLVVPWKYGFKSIKSINEIIFRKRQPKNSWQVSAANEYGFYANVNPQVDHPRWSQARERRIGTGLFGKKQPTLMFNGYAEQVAGLYSGMNLRRHF